MKTGRLVGVWKGAAVGPRVRGQAKLLIKEEKRKAKKT